MLAMGETEVCVSKSDPKSEADPIPPARSLPRREWLAAFAAGGVVTATGALGYSSCETRPRSADSPELELGYIKAAIKPLRERDYVADAKRQGLLREDIQEALAGDINEYMATSYQALVYSELVNALPDDLRESEAIQNDIAEMSPVLDQAVADSYFVVGMADDQIKAEIDRELRENPDVLMDMASGLDEEGARHGMGMHGRLRLRRASADLSSRLRVQSADEIITDLTDKITRVAERNGAQDHDNANFEVSPATRRMLAQYADPLGSTPPHPGPTEVETSPPSTTESPSSAEAESRRELKRLERKARRLTRASRGLAGTGGALLIVGGIAYGVTASVGALVPFCLAGLALLLALFILIAAARRRRQLEEAKAGAESTTGP
ncbi:MAG: hypothetical protein JRG93_10335 [Deltaproteobacteria bacterium]|nr:hypothetical protein [Deltaproteobacteria bacterium]